MKNEIVKLCELFDVYSKTVIDVSKKICYSGCGRQIESEQIILEQGSIQDDIWGGGIDVESLSIDCNSFINIRPVLGNTSNDIQNQNLRQEFESLTKYFFALLYDK